MPEVKVDNGIEDVEFFGTADKRINPETGEKQIMSEYPVWYFENQITDVKNQIKKMEFQLERGEIPNLGLAAHKAELSKLRDIDRKIEESTPVISNAAKDDIAKVHKSLGKKISESMFTRSEEMKGLPDAHEEYKRQFEPCIELDDKMILIARKLNIKPRGNKVSRNEASRIWKILSRSLGENSDTEYLRKG